MTTPLATPLRFLTQKICNATPMDELVADLQDALKDLGKGGLMPDTYLEGDVVKTLENKMATLLGKEAALFFITGTMAQQIALKLWCQQSDDNRVGLHAQSHLESSENGAYKTLSGLSPVFLGEPDRQFTKDDLEKSGKLGALTLEMPLRNAGGLLLNWDELSDVSQWAQDNKVPFHLDGARLWEAQPYYDKSFADIAALADSIYVSFYKGLGGLAGAVLAGPSELIEKAKVWRHRHGGNVFTAFPYAVMALRGLDTDLPQMAERRHRAIAMAAYINTLPAFTTWPTIPRANMFQVHLKHPVDELMDKGHIFEGLKNIRIFAPHGAKATADGSCFEIHVGASSLEFSNEETKTVLKQFNDLFYK